MQYTADSLKTLVTNYKSILNWGPPVMGKTYVLWTLVQWLKDKGLGPLHLYDIDKKCEALVRACEKHGLLEHLVVFQYRGKSNSIAAHQNTKKSVDVWMEWVTDINKYHQKLSPTGGWKEDYQGPGAIVVDTLTSFGDITLEFILAQLKHDIGSAGTDARSDFQLQMMKIAEAIDSIKDLPCISVWNGHEQLMQNEKTGEITCLPAVTGKKFPSTLAAKFNVVVYSYYSSGKYMWLVKPDPSKNVKSAGTTSRDDLGKTIEQDYRLLL